MKKVFLYAYDEGNLGDDLFVEILVRRYQDVRFYMWSGEEKNNYGNLPMIRKINPDKGLLRIANKISPSVAARCKNYYIERCDALVYIGGSIFIEYANWRDINSWWRYWAEKSRFYVLGANFGPYESEEYKNDMASIFEKMEDVCFRDRYSYRLFESADSVRYAPDILFGCDMPQIAEKEDKIFVSVINCRKKDEGSNQLGQYTEVYEKWLLELLKKYTDDNKKIILSSFCKKEGDEETADSLYEKLKEYKGDCHVEKCYYHGENRELVLEEIASSEFVIASRFHAVILGLLAGCKVLPVLYSDKTKNVLEDIGFRGKFIDIKKINIQGYEIKRFVQFTEMNVRKLKKKATVHFEKLDNVI